MRKDCKDKSSFSILQIFFQELCVFLKNLVTTSLELLYCKLSVFVRTTVFLKRGCKGSDFFRTCKYFRIFFQKISVFPDNERTSNIFTYIYKKRRHSEERRRRSPVKGILSRLQKAKRHIFLAAFRFRAIHRFPKDSSGKQQRTPFRRRYHPLLPER